jgi:hypothetical protein
MIDRLTFLLCAVLVVCLSACAEEEPPAEVEPIVLIQSVESVESVEEAPIPAPFADTPADRLRGRVIDTRTAQGIPDVWVRLRRRGEESLVRSDSEGFYFADRPLPEGKVSARVGLDRRGAWWMPSQARLEHAPASASAVHHVLRVESGPSYSLDFLVNAPTHAERWQARLVERDGEGGERVWSWQVLRTGTFPMLRYHSVEHEPDPRFRPRIELRQDGGDWFSRAPVTRTVGIAEHPIDMELVQYAAFGGSVVDAEDRPLADIAITLGQLSGDLLPMVSAALVTTYTSRGGDFFFEEGVEPGRYHLQVWRGDRLEVNFAIDIGVEGNDGYRVRLPAMPIAGAIHGILRGSGGAAPPSAILSLRSIPDGTVRRWLHAMETDPRWGSMTREEDRTTFFFDDLPPGRFELSLFPLDGASYRPTSMEVSAPLSNVVFERIDSGSPVTWFFDVRDAESGEVLEEFRVVYRTAGWWNPEGLLLNAGAVAAQLPSDTPTTWIIYQPGYLPRYGSFAEGPRDLEARTIRLELERGWGAELFLRDAQGGGDRPELDTWTTMARVHQAPPVAGVEIRADGVSLGKSDEQGVFRVELEAEPDRLEIGGAEWKAIDSTWFRDGRIVSAERSGAKGGEYRSVVVWMTAGE